MKRLLSKWNKIAHFTVFALSQQLLQYFINI